MYTPPFRAAKVELFFDYPKIIQKNFRQVPIEKRKPKPFGLGL
ncbi:hypothetical protein C943_03099 [Mariniradius saccharolyticus AK6]|uniref:Uncharacterized protein n=1 Tax=Mariniradius saccharolyticus AK6 TaxID=1239962 RepID=M7Y0X5_9BACT|nr:hypothetical protein C943_03099 [Mariniradius saccharolyticus AK6]